MNGKRRKSEDREEERRREKMTATAEIYLV
jgi:hypothetical protein